MLDGKGGRVWFPWMKNVGNIEERKGKGRNAEVWEVYISAKWYDEDAEGRGIVHISSDRRNG